MEFVLCLERLGIKGVDLVPLPLNPPNLLYYDHSHTSDHGPCVGHRLTPPDVHRTPQVVVIYDSKSRRLRLHHEGRGRFLRKLKGFDNCKLTFRFERGIPGGKESAREEVPRDGGSGQEGTMEGRERSHFSDVD